MTLSPYRSRFGQLALLFAMAAPVACPARATDATFDHGDWQLVCDNTRTCRAAGYQSDDAAMPVSVLLTRKAGAGTAVEGRVMLDDHWDDSVPAGPPEQLRVALWINGKSQGERMVTKNALGIDLSAAQVAALVKALSRDSRIEFRTGDVVWALSDRGAAAVLLKMDEFQGRIGTVGALYRTGKKTEAGVLPPLPAPIVMAAPLPPAKPGDAGFLARHGDALRAALRSSTDGEICDDLQVVDEAQPLDVIRLTKTKLLVSTRCWLAAYNADTGYWIINDTLPYHPEQVTTFATDFDNGTLSATHKGRGIGDCWGTERWTWDGSNFVHTALSTTGLCKGFAGGAWELPTLVSDVRR